MLYRSDTQAALSVVSSRYQVVQPRAVLEFYRDLTEIGGYEMETAGVLKAGRKFWALARTGKQVVLKGSDVVNVYLLLATSCDGTLATTVTPTTVRVVCNNTLSIALDGTSNAIRVPHNTHLDADLHQRVPVSSHRCSVEPTVRREFLRLIAENDRSSHSSPRLHFSNQDTQKATSNSIAVRTRNNVTSFSSSMLLAPCFFLYLGIRRCFSRKIRPERLFIFPILVAFYGSLVYPRVYPLATEYEWTLALVGLLCGSFVGWIHASKWTISFDRDSRRASIPGDPMLLFIMIAAIVLETFMRFQMVYHTLMTASESVGALAFLAWGTLLGMSIGRASNVVMRCFQLDRDQKK